MSNALVELEGQFPFNFSGSPTQDPSQEGGRSSESDGPFISAFRPMRSC